MHGKKIAVTLILLVISFAMMPPGVSAGGNHENFDHADTDISALFYMLNQTQVFMRLSLEHSLSVDYQHDLDREPLTCDHSDEDISESIIYARESERSVAAAASILEDIEDVSSAEYLEQLYLPHYRISRDLIMYSETHGGLMLNLSSTIAIYNSVRSGVRDETYLYEGLGALQKASLNLHRMNTYLSLIDDGVEELDTSLFDTSALEMEIEDNHVLLAYYREVIDELLVLFREIPSHLSFFTPPWAYPGEVITVYGHYMEGGGYVSGKTVEVRMDDTYIFSGETDQGGYYEIFIPVPWDATGSIRLNASTPENEIYVEAVVEIRRYPTNIVLEIPGYHFYDEDIPLSGRFETVAPVDLSTIELRAPGNITLMTDVFGDFHLIYHSAELGWGTHTINISYGGNISMMPCEASVVFEVSIPTHITLDCDRIGFFDDRSLPITFFGELTNISSTDGIPFQYISIQGGPHIGSYTDLNGTYSVNTTVDEMGLSKGLYVMYARFNGTRIYRGCVSDLLMIYLYIFDNGSYVIVYSLDDLTPWMDDHDPGNGDNDDPSVPGNGDNDDHDIFGLVREYFFLLLGLLLLMALMLVLYLSGKKEREESHASVKTEPVKPIRMLQQRGLPSAISKEDIPVIYARTLDVLDSRGIINITKGKTPRDIVGEITQGNNLKKYLGEFTSIFEKAFFSAHEVTTSEIRDFNRALKMIAREVRTW